MDSTLVVQQYIQQTIRKDPKGRSSSIVVVYQHIIINLMVSLGEMKLFCIARLTLY